jgi:small subunit ribosomal protein S1
MSKLQEKIELYTSEAEKLGLGLNAELLATVTKGLGPSIYKEDAEKVSSSDKKELETVKKNFLIKKLGLEDSEKLDEAIEAAIEKIGKSNRNKYRAIFYTILVEELGAQSFYAEKPAEEEKEVKEEVKEEDYYKVETSFGKFSRSFTLPDNADVENVEASGKDGVLEVVIPKLSEEKHKKIIEIK